MDGTEERKDTSQPGDSSGEDQETSEKEAPTFTKEQSEAITRKAVNDALSAAGRTAQAFEKREQTIKDSEEHLSQSISASRQAELDANKGDDDALAAIRKRHTEADRQAKFEERERKTDEKDAKADEKLEKVTKADIKERAQVVATKHDVDASTLEKHTDGSLESMEELAKGLTKLGKATPPITTDSGKTIGGGSMPNNLEDFKAWSANLTQTEYESKATEIDARLKELQNQ